MKADTDNHYYSVRAQQELNMAALATESNVKALHENMAAQYASLREREDAKTQNKENATND